LIAHDIITVSLFIRDAAMLADLLRMVLSVVESPGACPRRKRRREDFVVDALARS
jgi:hypothetical protein